MLCRAKATVMTLLLAGLLAGCATVEQVGMPPASLAQACVEPPATVHTNGEVGDYVLALKSALRGCAAQVDGLGAWIAAHQGHGQK
jgi:hypothetical protein